MTRDGDWHWMELNGCAPHAVEFVYNRHELLRVLETYGRTAGEMLVRASSAPRYRVMARGLFTGRLLGQYAWEWAPDLGRYTPEPEPWIVWSDRRAVLNSSHPQFPGYSLSGLSRYVRAAAEIPTLGMPRLGIELAPRVQTLGVLEETIPTPHPWAS
ncbi:hypothetical protein [Streptomyces sp. SP17KL33]|uniref:hypothetical protein n=1 Tax=Streptomyces sp. SP17KL33 TaxID=3002534 RepID=UPI002E7A12C6|nr:hypothetical protein [Streptomyces sp. SP17KL33]MEE1835784.1 hypothetical protein [Streptomyces sp. SP17KL33]